MKQPVRPTQIESIMKTIVKEYPAELGASLEAYITELEARPPVIASGDDEMPAMVPDDSPLWSHERMAKHEEKRRQRALRKYSHLQ
jgi:hypothetical protein